MVAILLLSYFPFRNRVAKIAIFTEKATIFSKIYVYQPILRQAGRIEAYLAQMDGYAVTVQRDLPAAE